MVKQMEWQYCPSTIRPALINRLINLNSLEGAEQVRQTNIFAQLPHPLCHHMPAESKSRSSREGVAP